MASGPALLADTFRLLRPLAYGGLGGVHLAEHVSTGQQYAVKMLQYDGAEPQVRHRFLQEPRLLVRIPSDHVAQVVRICDNEIPAWFVMELLDGESLDQRLHREEYLEPGEAVAVLAQVCKALDAAHRRDIVHCDIKPGNI